MHKKKRFRKRRLGFLDGGGHGSWREDDSGNRITGFGKGKQERENKNPCSKWDQSSQINEMRLRVSECALAETGTRSRRKTARRLSKEANGI